MFDFVLLLLTFVVILLLPMSLGRRFLSGSNSNAEAYAIGLLLLTGLCFVLGAFSILHVKVIVAVALALFCIHLKQLKECVAVMVNGFKQYWNHDQWAKTLIVLVLTLLCIRFFRALVPLLNWDSVGYHFLQLRERLIQGDLAELFHVATDRRSPLLGVISKSWAFAFDSAGSGVVMLNFCAYLMSLIFIAKSVKQLINLKAVLLTVCAVVSLTDIAVYIISAGDEALLGLSVCFAVWKLVEPKSESKRWVQITPFLFLGLGMGLKLTALFWIPILVMCLVWKFISDKRLVGLGFIGFLLVSCWGYFDTYQKYDMVYPFTRWTNLLYTGQEGTPMFTAEAMRQERKLLGLEKDTNDHPLADKIKTTWLSNAKKWLFLPLGPYVLWFVIALPFMLYMLKKESYPKMWFFIKGVMLGLFILAITMAAWPLSPQAFMRYHLPTWLFFIPSMFAIVYLVSEKFKLIKGLSQMLIVMLVFACLIEAKALLAHSPISIFKPTKEYWEQKLADGKILQKFQAKRQTGQASIYFGSCGFFLEGEKTWFAQLGNEVGWRSPKKLEEFLNRQKIVWWVIGESCEKLENPYTALTKVLISKKILVLDERVGAGAIYRVQLEASTSASETSK